MPFVCRFGHVDPGTWRGDPAHALPRRPSARDDGAQSGAGLRHLDRHLNRLPRRDMLDFCAGRRRPAQNQWSPARRAREATRGRPMRAQALRRAGPWRYLAPHADGATTCSPPVPLLSGSSPIEHQRTNAYQPVPQTGRAGTQLPAPSRLEDVFGVQFAIPLRDHQSDGDQRQCAPLTVPHLGPPTLLDADCPGQFDRSWVMLAPWPCVRSTRSCMWLTRTPSVTSSAASGSRRDTRAMISRGSLPWSADQSASGSPTTVICRRPWPMTELCG